MATFRWRDEGFAGTAEEKCAGLQGVVLVFLDLELPQLGELLNTQSRKERARVSNQPRNGSKRADNIQVIGALTGEAVLE